MNTLISIVIALIVAGFVFWALRLIIGLLPLEPLFKQVIDVLIIILVVGIIIFYVVIPLLHMLGGVSLNQLGVH
jgi:hypothetical protein